MITRRVSRLTQQDQIIIHLPVYSNSEKFTVIGMPLRLNIPNNDKFIIYVQCNSNKIKTYFYAYEDDQVEILPQIFNLGGL